MAREETLRIWQTEWTDHQRTAQWTKRLIPNIVDWYKCKHRRTDYFVTQALTGHGSFKKYTFKIGKSNDDICAYCPNTSDTPEHTIFHCVRWVNERMRLDIDVNVDNLRENMLSNKEVFEKITSFLKAVMKAKEKEERERQGRGDS